MKRILPCLMLAACGAAPTDTHNAGVQSATATTTTHNACGYWKEARRVCERDGFVHTFISYTGCIDNETVCDAHAPAEEKIDDGTCYQNESVYARAFNGTCQDFRDFWDGKIECYADQNCASRGGVCSDDHVCMCNGAPCPALSAPSAEMKPFVAGTH